MSPATKIKRLLAFGDRHGLEIISYGLAPNPNGFSFEVLDTSIDPEVVIRFRAMLDNLNKKETEILRKAVFQ